MATFKRFEDIIAWQKARDLNKTINGFIHKKEVFFKDYALRNQIERSAGSIMDNIAEGFGRMGNGEFSHFLAISLGSAREFQSQLYRALDKGYIIDTEFQVLFSLSEEICKILHSLIFQLKKSELAGLKFKS